MARSDARFTEVITLIEAARGRAYQAVNAELVSLYWQLGAYISRKIASAEWGDGVVDELAALLARRFPGQRGFTRPNLFRMRQFFEAYRSNQKVSALLRQLPWTHHLKRGTKGVNESRCPPSWRVLGSRRCGLAPLPA